jgi:hypothetical protein
MFPFWILDVKEFNIILSGFNMCKWDVSRWVDFSGGATYAIVKTSINNYKKFNLGHIKVFSDRQFLRQPNCLDS